MLKVAEMIRAVRKKAKSVLVMVERDDVKGVMVFAKKTIDQKMPIYVDFTSILREFYLSAIQMKQRSAILIAEVGGGHINGTPDLSYCLSKGD